MSEMNHLTIPLRIEPDKEIAFNGAMLNLYRRRMSDPDLQTLFASLFIPDLTQQLDFTEEAKQICDTISKAWSRGSKKPSQNLIDYYPLQEQLAKDMAFIWVHSPANLHHSNLEKLLAIANKQGKYLQVTVESNNTAYQFYNTANDLQHNGLDNNIQETKYKLRAFKKAMMKHYEPFLSNIATSKYQKQVIVGYIGVILQIIPMPLDGQIDLSKPEAKKYCSNQLAKEKNT